MNKISISLLALFFLPSLVLASTSDPSWKVWKKKSGLEVRYRPAIALNKKLSAELIEIKAIAKVNSTLAGFLLFIQQVDNTPNWLVNASTSKIIKQISKNENIFFIQFSGVWPLRPRLLILHSTYWQNDDLSVEIALSDDTSLTDTMIAQQLGDNMQQFLRIKTYQAHWRITPDKRNTVEQSQQTVPPPLLIEYTFIADGTGDSPKWLAEHLALKSIWKSMRNIKRQLPTSQWQKSTVDGISERNSELGNELNTELNIEPKPPL